MRAAVITTVHGRSEHLRGQLRGMAESSRPPDLHIVAIDDDDVSTVATGAGGTAEVVDYTAGTGPLPIAAARNAGACAALDRRAELLVFLDVDCIPSPVMVERYLTAANRPEHRDAPLCGPVTYLPPPGPAGYPPNLEPLIHPHRARPSPPDGQIADSSDYELFWSLSFALSTHTWRRIGGFCTQYRGYGAEDTDFAQTASVTGIPMRWVGGAHPFHQHHPVSDPPVEHLHDIVRTAEVFHRRWGW